MRVQNNMVCPNCCAPLQVQPYSSTAVCRYCDSVLSLEQEQAQVQYAPGGMQDAERIRVLRMNLQKLEQLKNKQQQCSKLLQQTNAERFAPPYPVGTPKYQQNAIAAGGLIAIVGLISLGLLSSSSWLAGIIVMGMCVLAVFILVRYYQSEAEKFKDARAGMDALNQTAYAEWESGHRQRLSDAEAKLNTAQSAVTALQNQTDFTLVPAQYQNEAALRYFYDVLSMNQAYNIGQAIRLYEMKQESDRREEQLQAQIRMQQEQINSQQAQIRSLPAQMNTAEESRKGNPPSKCPKCGNRNGWREVSKTSEGYNVGAAIVGTIFLGAAGLLAGAVGNDVHHYACDGCGYRCEYK